MSPDRESEKIELLKTLARQYIQLEHGALIERPHELIRFFDVEGELFGTHPHYGFRVYISRRALKHVVERRMEQLPSDTPEYSREEFVFFIIECVQEVVINFDKYEVDENDKHFYFKDFAHIKKPGIRVVVEKKVNTLEIVSIHYRKHPKLK